jgi:hypothetical protein
MKFIAHRINTIAQLELLPPGAGAEIDVRDYGNQLILQHDPFTGKGELLEDFLAASQSVSRLILNVKSEGIEYRIVEMLKTSCITSWFFLDSSFPVMYRMTLDGVRNFAVRISSAEGTGLAENMKGLAEWIWADFLGEPSLDSETCSYLKSLGYKICLVSPGITGMNHRLEWYISVLFSEKIIPDAVCARADEYPLWKPLLILNPDA